MKYNDVTVCDKCGKIINGEPYELFNSGKPTFLCKECFNLVKHKSPLPVVEELNASDIPQLIQMSAEQTWAFEQGLKVGKEMVEDNKHKEQIKAINSVQKELHELNKTLKLIAGRLKA